MAVKVITDCGTAACPRGSWALYGNLHFNTDGGDNANRVLVSDESVVDLSAYRFQGKGMSLVNRTGYDVTCYTGPAFVSNELVIPNGGARTNLHDTRVSDTSWDSRRWSMSIESMRIGVPSEGELPENRVYLLAERKWGYLLGLADESKDNGTAARATRGNGRASHQWELAQAGDARFTLRNVFSGKCLDNPAGSTEDGAKLHQWEADGGINQQWRFTRTAEDTYTLTSASSGKLLDVVTAGTKSHHVVQHAASGSVTQQWRLIPFEEPHAVIDQQINSLYVRATAAVHADGTLMRAQGVTGVTKLGTGRYDVALEASVRRQGAAYQATLDQNADPGSEVYIGDSETPNSVRVITGRSGNASDQPFHIVIL
ncbi:RICIN domain-containing protein [Streptomyces sp. NPDC005728]|uniref:RICIN domain-containing protein n=1 Tax=Streptomyces sp. NPDC005728 TaxID=3157054 RepID=UPI0033E4AC34